MKSLVPEGKLRTRVVKELGSDISGGECASEVSEPRLRLQVTVLSLTPAYKHQRDCVSSCQQTM